MVNCRVRCCRWRTSHVTAGHRCGTCGTFGHGQLECGKESLIGNLQSLYVDDRVLVECSVPQCPAPWTHNTSAHHCGGCDRRGEECICFPTSLSKHCPSCRVLGEVDLSYKLFTGSDCIVCMDSKPCVVFKGCRHATVCAECVIRLDV